MASSIVIPTAADIGACATEVATNLSGRGDPDARLANALIDVATAAKADVNALQAGTSIAAVNGVTMPAGGALTVGTVLRATAAGTAAYGAVDLANASAVTGVLPGANQALAISGGTQGAVSGTDKAYLDALYAARKRIATVNIRNTNLTAAATSQTFNLDSALPANARIEGVAIKLATPGSGGGATSVSAKIGSAGDDDAIVATADLFAAAIDGQCSAFSFGIAPNRHFGSSTQLTVTITSDVNVNTVSALNVTFDVGYTVIA